MVSNISLLLQKLKNRGVEITEKDNISDLDRLERNLSITLGLDFISMYKYFNGFATLDHNSYFTMWSIDEIIKQNIDQIGASKESYFKIGDFMIDSDYIIAQICLDKAEVKMLYEDILISSSIIDLFVDLASGKKDLFH